MRAGELVRVDFGVPVGSEPGFTRPAVVVTADLVLAGQPRALHVVPVTSNVARRLSTELPIESPALDRPSAAQCHLLTVVATERVVERELGQIGVTQLAQVRSLLADLLDIA